jgi:hypothetical protein
VLANDVRLYDAEEPLVQQVVAEPQPSSLAGSNAHGVEVRAMNSGRPD